MNYFFTCITKKYASIGGRASRSDYWNFLFYNLLFQCLILAVAVVLTAKTEIQNQVVMWTHLSINIALLIPTVCATIRRLHDIGKSGMNLLWIVLPVIGWLLLLIYLLKDSRQDMNDYGPDPNVMDSDADIPIICEEESSDSQ